MKNIFLVFIFTAVFFLPAHLATANITNPGFNSAEEDGLYGWMPNELVSAVYYPDASSGKAAHFLPDSMNTNPLSSLSQVFWLDLDSKTLSFDVEITTFESGIFKAALLDPLDPERKSLVDTVDGINFFTISSEGIQLGDKELDVLGLGERWVELVFNLENDTSFDTEAWLYNLDILKNVPVVPIPPAVVLGGIGVVLVGWLRRRRTL